MYNVTNDELIHQLVDSAVDDFHRVLRGEAARRLIVCEQLVEFIHKNSDEAATVKAFSKVLLDMFKGK